MKKAKRMLKPEKKRIRHERQGEKKTYKKFIKNICISFMIILSLIAIYFLVTNFLNKKEETEAGILEEKEVLGMELKDIKIEEKDGVYKWKAILTNTSGEKFNNKRVQLIFKSEEGNKIYKYPYKITDLEKGETQEIEIKTSEPLDEFAEFDIKGIVEK